MKTKIAVLVSGGGTNLQALIDAQGTTLVSGEIALVVANNANAYALERAKKANIPTAVVLKKERNFSSGVISRPLFLSFGILVPPVIQIEVPARMPDHACCAARWDWISYRIMPAATDTL